ncbi:uncharacterized protein LOC135137071 [Zophobas morio]|uniref:uncharacterized protein LOC135137071 n=1 Tax=Zophobas morio TaxID=2755281 RepID=UPI003082B6E1
MNSIFDMETNYLKASELNHELKIRGTANPERLDHDTKRRYLRRKLREDMNRPNLQYSTPNFDFDLEKAEVDQSIAELRTMLSVYDGINTDMDKRIQTKVNHLMGRIRRFEVGEDKDDQKAYKEDNLILVESLEEMRLQIMEQVSDVDRVVRTVGRTDNSSRAVETVKSMPVYKWGIVYDGRSTQESVSSFLQRIEELRIARGTSKEELFRSAVDLFQGQALVWYRSVRGSINSWEELVAALRRDFLPSDFDDDLWREIRNRTQGQQERVTIYIAYMQNLFGRLSEVPTEDVQLKTIRRNLLPAFQDHLALMSIQCVRQLADICRTLESSFEQQRRFQPPPRRSVALLEPDLAYNLVEAPHAGPSNSSRRASVAAVSDITCYNCRKTGHISRNCPSRRQRPICRGCGRPGFIRPNCPSCSKN